MDNAATTAELLTFTFVAASEERTIRFFIRVPDDGRPMVDLADDAYEQACEYAAKRLGTDVFDCVDGDGAFVA